MTGTETHRICLWCGKEDPIAIRMTDGNLRHSGPGENSVFLGREGSDGEVVLTGETRKICAGLVVDLHPGVSSGSDVRNYLEDARGILRGESVGAPRSGSVRHALSLLESGLAMLRGETRSSYPVRLFDDQGRRLSDGRRVSDARLTSDRVVKGTEGP